MNYSTELCQLVVKNMEVIEEAPNVVEYIQEKLFLAINTRIKERVTDQGEWYGVYELNTGKKGVTFFGLTDWLVDENNLFGYFAISTQGAEDSTYWLSDSIGFRGAKLALQFELDAKVTGLNAREHKKRLQDFYSATPTLAESGFLTKNSVIYRPFSFDASLLAEELWEFVEVLAPLDAALDDLFKVLPKFDEFVKELRTKL